MNVPLLLSVTENEREYEYLELGGSPTFITPYASPIPVWRIGPHHSAKELVVTVPVYVHANDVVDAADMIRIQRTKVV